MKKLLMILSFLLATNCFLDSKESSLNKNYTTQKAITFLEEKGFVIASPNDFKQRTANYYLEKEYSIPFFIKELTDPSEQEEMTIGKEKLSHSSVDNPFPNAFITIPLSDKEEIFFTFYLSDKLRGYIEGFNLRFYYQGSSKEIYKLPKLIRDVPAGNFSGLNTSDKKAVKDFFSLMSSGETLIYRYNFKGREYEFILAKEDQEDMSRTAQVYLELVDFFTL